MARVDICYDDLGGIYIDNKWVPVSSIDVNRVDHPGEAIYVMGSSTAIHVEPPRPEWTVRIEMTGPRGPTMEMTINDPEMHFWPKRQEYVYDQEMYVIQEMQP